jgi:hypothetical protein
MGMYKQSTQLNVKKIYEFIFRDKTYTLDEDEARQIKKLFMNMLPDKEDTVKFSSSTFKGMMDNVVVFRRRNIPEGYVKIGSSETAPKMGNKPTLFDYYKNEENSYAFSVPSQTRLAFCRLGKISDPKSIIGRCVRMIPQYESFNRGDLKRLGVISSSEYRKSLCDILEIEGYIQKVSTVFAENQHARHTYKQTNKIDGLEVDNNHGFPKEEGFPPTHK